MNILSKKIFFTILFNGSLFVMLLIGIQNSSNKKKVNIFINETIELPISFIIGISFISGTLTGSLLNSVNRKTKN
tara:strand:- start:7459 stop:7683 length:225 start_codon:yes stop_codon:yes gene_type:complete